MAIGSKLNTVGKFMTYVYALIAVVFVLAAIAAGSQSAKEKKRGESIGYFGLAALMTLFIFGYVFIARKKYGGRTLLGFEGLRFIM